MFLSRGRKLAILGIGCSMRLPSCVNRAKHIFTDWLLKNDLKPEAEIRNMVYTTGKYVLLPFYIEIIISFIVKQFFFQLKNFIQNL